MTLNMALGGSGGSITVNRKPFTKKHSDESKQKMSTALKGKKRTEETKQRLSETSWAKSRPDEQREHARAAGKASHLNRKPTKEQRLEFSNKISNSLKRHFRENGSAVTGTKRQRISCPHCDKDGARNTMLRWHFNNCKNKPMV